jgi:hypothetical protein
MWSAISRNQTSYLYWPDDFNRRIAERGIPTCLALSQPSTSTLSTFYECRPPLFLSFYSGVNDLWIKSTEPGPFWKWPSSCPILFATQRLIDQHSIPWLLHCLALAFLWCQETWFWASEYTEICQKLMLALLVWKYMVIISLSRRNWKASQKTWEFFV